ncbi:MAG: TMEM43 family protein [Patescibacteria group bacterium]
MALNLNNLNLGNMAGNVAGNMGRRPYTVRKSGGIVGSFIAALLGIGFVLIGSPLALWYAESQHKAQDFATAAQVQSNDVQPGYVAVSGTATVTDGLTCPNTTAATDCIYLNTQTQRFDSKQERKCGSLSSNERVIQNLPDECDSDGKNCQSCYQIERTDWNTIDTKTAYQPFTVGSYSIQPSSDVNFIGTQDYTTTTNATPAIGDQRNIYKYYEASNVKLVAGTSANGKISTAADNKPYVISNVDYAGTLSEIKSQDTSTKWGLRILSFILMVVGMSMIVSPLTALTNVFRFIPFIGGRIDRGFDAIIGFVAGLFGAVMWVVLWGVVLLIKNIWIALIAVVVLVVVIVLVARMFGKKRATTSGATTTPTGSSQG